MTDLLSRADGPPSAVFCQSDEMAFGVLQALQRVGVRVPDEVSVVGFDDHELADAFQLTTVGQPISAQGAAAARWLTAGLDTVQTGLARPGLADAVHPVRLVCRGSTGPPPDLRDAPTLRAAGPARTDSGPSVRA
jgi:LacI family repressor for deo operon, udp, cdd, tsx, nupC, and nupG